MIRVCGSCVFAKSPHSLQTLIIWEMRSICESIYRGITRRFAKQSAFRSHLFGLSQLQVRQERATISTITLPLESAFFSFPYLNSPTSHRNRDDQAPNLSQAYLVTAFASFKFTTPHR